MITKKEAVKYVADHSGLTHAQSEKALSAVINLISGTLHCRESIGFKGFGSFKTKWKKAYTGKNPATGAPMEVPAKYVIKFVPAKALKEAVA